MNSSFGDNKKRLGGSSSAVTEAKRRATVGQTWNFQSKQPKLPSAGYITTIEAMTASTLAYENARNAGVVPRIHLGVAVPTTTLTATVAATPFAPVVVTGLVAIADSPVFSVSPALPFGLSFSSSTGRISGTPMETITSTTFTVTVRATSIYPTPVTSSATFTMTVGDSTRGLAYTGYSNVPLSSSAPSLRSLPPNAAWGVQSTTVAGTVSGAARSTNEMFYTNTLSNIAVRFTGYFKAPLTGNYVFGINSDDGIQISMDNRVSYITDHPATSATFTGDTSSISLSSNVYYPFDGVWGQGGGPGNLLFTSMSVNSTDVLSTYPIKTLFFR